MMAGETGRKGPLCNHRDATKESSEPPTVPWLTAALKMNPKCPMTGQERNLGRVQGPFNR